ncbi:threonine ammonia-lyase [Desulforamulus hydrothermalis]|uniref:L-threonine dehydratase catabolic TdcB n=1 Tax=Desulforamulus hydrothermalis Lam5 = DSM 18033 TaxID=1121428 RepID=K8EB18_9FIRM|nr:threonine ammonia-lyase [Desulforamulus hydrothermalis]CCO08838.1 L-threonine ammonia-lyase [Desulforamulus hydrothermalis Lam5 = DSM 18033]SHG72856.1 threonine dehydratase [Desulforamulus hydrothermalis Lam5 = DSM 18033]
MSKISLEDIKAARQCLKGVIHRTDLVPNTTLSEISGSDVYLKLENLQKTGSFKIRGAFNKMCHLSETEKRAGVIASSAGNHAQGVALAASTYGIKSTIVMPTSAPLAKITATRNYGAEVVLHGNVYDDAYAKAMEIQRETGATFVHPFNDPYVIAGQGAIGLEILDDLPDADAIIVPIGGGGIIAGIALAAKAVNPSIKVIGVEPCNAASMRESIKSRQVVTLANAATIADGIAVKTPGQLTYDIVKEFVDDFVVVDEGEIANAILVLLERCKLIAEGAGATPVAALLNGKVNLPGQKVVAVISGGNIDVNMLSRIVDKGLAKAGRKTELTTIIPDKPGQLQRLLKTVSDLSANVVEVHHNRIRSEVELGQARVDLVLETQDMDHLHNIISELVRKGYRISRS